MALVPRGPDHLHHSITNKVDSLLLLLENRLRRGRNDDLLAESHVTLVLSLVIAAATHYDDVDTVKERGRVTGAVATRIVQLPPYDPESKGRHRTGR